jgi:hypothetical protein
MRLFLAIALSVVSSLPLFAQGNLSRNRYDPNSTANPYGAGRPPIKQRKFCCLRFNRERRCLAI